MKTLSLHALIWTCILVIALSACDIAPTIPQDFDDPAFDFVEGSDLYSPVASYCYTFTGYGGDLCLDWTESVLRDHNGSVSNCFAQVESPLSDQHYAQVKDCLQSAGVPDPL